MNGESELAAKRQPETIYMRRLIGGLTLTGLASTLAYTGAAAEANDAAIAEKPSQSSSKKSWDKIKWKTTFRDDFKRTELGDAWSVAAPIEWHDGWNKYSPENVYADGEFAVFVVDRHCLVNAEDERTLANAQVEPCADELITSYAGARMEQNRFDMQGAFRVKVKATLPRKEGRVDGVRSAAWIINDQPRCDALSKTDTVELDIFEYIKAKKTTDIPFSTSHVGCDKLDFDTVYHKKKFEKGWEDEPHVYEVIYTGNLDGNRIIYKIDGTIIAETSKEDWHSLFDSSKDFKDTERADFNRMMMHMFGVVLSADAMEGDSTVANAYRRPDPTKDFPRQEYKVDWVKTMEPTKQSLKEFTKGR